MAAEDAKRIVSQFWKEVYNRGDFELLEAIVAPSYKLHDPGAGHLVFIEEVNEEVAFFLLGAEEARVARQGPATGKKTERLLRRLPGHLRRLASKLGDLLTR